MRKLSYMYQLSGGCGPRSICRDCCNLVEVETGKRKNVQCSRYPGNEQTPECFWNLNWPACAWFNHPDEEKITRGKDPAVVTTRTRKSSEQIEGQMSLEDFLR